jgi:small-conductance mechanosensitive channel
MRQFALAALTLALAVTAGCRGKQTTNAATSSDTTPSTPAPDTASPAQPAAPAGPGAFSFDQRQEFVGSIRQQLASADQQIKDLATQVKSQGGAVSDRALAAVRTARKQVDQTLKRVDAATAANWEQVKSAVNRSVERLNESIEVAQPK